MLSLSSTPTDSKFDEYYFCDYIELLALCSNSDDISVSDVIDRFYDDNSDDFDQGGRDHSEKSDAWERKVSDWFINLEARESVFGESYPFSITSRNFISLNRDLSQQQHLYIFFLLCANSSRTSDGNKSSLRSDFETISTKAFSEYLPSFSISHTFGKSAQNDDRYSGTLREKVKKLAEDLGLTFVAEDDYFSQYNTGDYGLDVVGWIPFPGDDHLKNIQIYLGQCATGRNWLNKQLEPVKVENAIHGLHKSTKMFFVPFDCRNANRSFTNKADITTHLMFDRCRLVFLLKDAIEALTDLGSYQLVIDAIEYEEDLV